MRPCISVSNLSEVCKIFSFSDTNTESITLAEYIEVLWALERRFPVSTSVLTTNASSLSWPSAGCYHSGRRARELPVHRRYLVDDSATAEAALEKRSTVSANL
jgi:hypothetical protein